MQSSNGSVLHEACFLNDVKSVKLLLAWEASVESVFNDLTPLRAAVLFNSHEAASIIKSRVQSSLFAVEQGVDDAHFGQKQTESSSSPLSGFYEYFRSGAPRPAVRADRAHTYFAQELCVSTSNSERGSV